MKNLKIVTLMWILLFSCSRCVYVPVWWKLWLLLWPIDWTLLWRKFSGNYYVKQIFVYADIKLVSFLKFNFLVLCISSLGSITTTLTLSSTCTGMERSTLIFLLPTSQTVNVLKQKMEQPLQTLLRLPQEARRKRTNQRVKLLNRYCSKTATHRKLTVFFANKYAPSLSFFILMSCIHLDCQRYGALG